MFSLVRAELRGMEGKGAILDGETWRRLEEELMSIVRDPEMLKRLREHPEVRQRDCGDGITAYNFTRRAFAKGLWDETTVKARGLFMRGESILGRGYDKFFDAGAEQGYTLDDLKDDFGSYLFLSRKYNGYLGILFYDEQEGRLRVFTKGGNTGEHARRAEEMVLGSIRRNGNEQEVKRGLSGAVDVPLSATFEIILTEDPHVIDEGEPKAVLLDLIRNDTGKPLPKLTARQVAERMSLGIPMGEHDIITSAEDFEAHWQARTEEWKRTEGMVVCDGRGRMVKAKTDYYRLAKQMRNELRRVLHGKPLKGTQTPAQQALLAHPEVLDAVRDGAYTFVNLIGEKDVNMVQVLTDYPELA